MCKKLHIGLNVWCYIDTSRRCYLWNQCDIHQQSKYWNCKFRLVPEWYPICCIFELMASDLDYYKLDFLVSNSNIWLDEKYVLRWTLCRQESYLFGQNHVVAIKLPNSLMFHLQNILKYRYRIRCEYNMLMRKRDIYFYLIHSEYG